jgi:hypothetical protein
MQKPVSEAGTVLVGVVKEGLNLGDYLRVAGIQRIQHPLQPFDPQVAIALVAWIGIDTFLLLIVGEGGSEGLDNGTRNSRNITRTPPATGNVCGARASAIIS